MNQFAPWLILFLPLAASVLITLFTLRHARLSMALSLTAVFASLLLCAGLGYDALSGHPPDSVHLDWLNVGSLVIPFGLHFDRLSLLMLLIITGVGSLIHLYSVAYMKGDRSVSRFFAALSFFTFAMLGIVLSDNFLQMFIFWELVGAASYLLVGFWYERAAAADAAKKAFLTNRLGDFGFFTGILLLWGVTGTLGFSGVQEQIAAHPGIFGTAATSVGLLIFCGAVGKSAQFPLHVWLPDAMEGPTPVSALIHAATMVAAGVYMLCRVFFLFDASALHVIAWTGGFTAILAALIACQQNDIKRILAYSTLSQLGYMVMAVGLGNPPAAMFHLSTHAFFKALLFLGAGSVIHALHHEQDIWKMGRLRAKMPITFWTFLAGTLALCGLFPFSGFFSKDALLAAAFEGDKVLFGVGSVVALLTTFYMFRLFFVAFAGPAKSDLSAHAHESPWIMTVPLALLSILAVIGGFIGIPQFLAPHFHTEPGPIFAPFAEFRAAPVVVGISQAVFVLGVLMAWALYRKSSIDPLPARLGAISTLLRRKFYFDELYARFIAVTQGTISVLACGVDGVLKLIVRGVEGTADLTGRSLRMVQTGNLQTYTFVFAVGIALALYLMLLR